MVRRVEVHASSLFSSLFSPHSQRFRLCREWRPHGVHISGSARAAWARHGAPRGALRRSTSSARGTTATPRHHPCPWTFSPAGRVRHRVPDGAPLSTARRPGALRAGTASTAPARSGPRPEGHISARPLFLRGARASGAARWPLRRRPPARSGPAQAPLPSTSANQRCAAALAVVILSSGFFSSILQTRSFTLGE